MTTVASAKHRRQPQQKSVFQRVVLPALIILVGLAVLMYPVVSTQSVSYTHLTLPTIYSV